MDDKVLVKNRFRMRIGLGEKDLMRVWKRRVWMRRVWMRRIWMRRVWMRMVWMRRVWMRIGLDENRFG